MKIKKDKDKFEIEYIDNLNENYLLEKAVVEKEYSGLPYDLWIESKGAYRNNKHNLPRLKVKINNTLIPVIISEEPDIPDSVKKQGTKTFKGLNEVKAYIKKYLQVFLDHWYGRVGDRDTLNKLNK